MNGWRSAIGTPLEEIDSLSDYNSTRGRVNLVHVRLLGGIWHAIPPHHLLVTYLKLEATSANVFKLGHSYVPHLSSHQH